jgi:glycine/sarcosine/betaine reductase complex component A
MDLGSQEKIKELADEHDRNELLVVLGAPDDEAAEIAAETIIFGDPTYAGALTEAQLGLDVYHVLEDDIKSEIPDDIWEEQVGVMADALEAEALAEAVRNMRTNDDEEG